MHIRESLSNYKEGLTIRPFAQAAFLINMHNLHIGIWPRLSGVLTTQRIYLTTSK